MSQVRAWQQPQKGWDLPIALPVFRSQDLDMVGYVPDSTMQKTSSHQTYITIDGPRTKIRPVLGGRYSKR